jgi:hypothetical protein
VGAKISSGSAIGVVADEDGLSLDGSLPAKNAVWVVSMSALNLTKMPIARSLDRINPLKLSGWIGSFAYALID